MLLSLFSLLRLRNAPIAYTGRDVIRLHAIEYHLAED